MSKSTHQLNSFNILHISKYLSHASLLQLCLLNKKFTTNIPHLLNDNHFFSNHDCKFPYIETTIDDLFAIYKHNFQQRLKQFQRISIEININTLTSNNIRINREIYRTITSLKIVGDVSNSSIQLNELFDSLQLYCVSLQQLDVDSSVFNAKYMKKRFIKSIIKLIPSVNFKKLIFRRVEIKKNTTLKLLSKLHKVWKRSNNDLEICLILEEHVSTQNIIQINEAVSKEFKLIITGNIWIIDIFETLQNDNILPTPQLLEDICSKINLTITPTSILQMVYKKYYFQTPNLVLDFQSNVDFLDLNLLDYITINGSFPYSLQFLSSIKGIKFNQVTVPHPNSNPQLNLVSLSNLTTLTLTTSSSRSHIPINLPTSLKQLVLTDSFINSFTEFPTISSITSLQHIEFNNFHISETLLIPTLDVTSLSFTQCHVRIRSIPSRLSKLTTFQASNCQFFSLEVFPFTLQTLFLSNLNLQYPLFASLHLIELSLESVTFSTSFTLPPTLQSFKINNCSVPTHWDLSTHSILEKFDCVNCSQLIELKLPKNIKQLKIHDCSELVILSITHIINLQLLSLSINLSVLNELVIPFSFPKVHINKENNTISFGRY